MILVGLDVTDRLLQSVSNVHARLLWWGSSRFDLSPVHKRFLTRINRSIHSLIRCVCWSESSVGKEVLPRFWNFIRASLLSTKKFVSGPRGTSLFTMLPRFRVLIQRVDGFRAAASAPTASLTQLKLSKKSKSTGKTLGYQNPDCQVRIIIKIGIELHVN